MNYSRQCQCCGRRVTAYLVHLNAGLVSAFVAFAEARIRLGRPVRKAEIALDHSQYGNFQKLKHFGLVELSTFGNSKEDEATEGWEMTPAGWSFLRGGLAVDTPAAQFGNTTLTADHEAWSTHKEPRRMVTIREVLPTEWQTRAEYAAQKAGAAA